MTLLPRRTALAEEKEVPWFVRQRVPLKEVRQRLLEPPNHEWSPISQKEWNAFLERKRQGKLKADRGANTTLRCPGCGRFLRHFYITADWSTLKKAKTDRRVHGLISGYICWFPCTRTWFLNGEGKLVGLSHVTF